MDTILSTLEPYDDEQPFEQQRRLGPLWSRFDPEFETPVRPPEAGFSFSPASSFPARRSHFHFEETIRGDSRPPTCPGTLAALVPRDDGDRPLGANVPLEDAIYDRRRRKGTRNIVERISI